MLLERLRLRLTHWKTGLVDLAGFGRETLILPRWIFLRLLGITYLVAFAGYCIEGGALVGPHGLEPLAEVLRLIVETHPSLLRYPLFPSVFWLSSSAAMVMAVAYCGVAAGLAVTLNLWPRFSLTVCWILFCSFIATTIDFSPTIVDRLLLETTLVAIPFAPRGFRPGLGRASPPSSWSILFIRFLAFRLLFETGFAKLASSDGYWRTLEYMGRMRENTPFPTYLAFVDHSLPRAWHAVETALTLVAELGAAVLVLLGLRARFVGACLFIGLQISIWLTSNFGWLNFVAIALCLLLFDDRAMRMAAPPRVETRDRRWQTILFAMLWAMNAGCGTVLLVLLVVGGTSQSASPTVTQAIINLPFKPAGLYAPFAGVDSDRYLVELAGTDDGGKTWQPYEYKFVQQAPGRMCPWIAPYFARFDAAVQRYGSYGGSRRRLFQRLGENLLMADPATLRLFRSDPFGGRAPQAIRYLRYRMTLNDWSSYRATGEFWRREYVDDFRPGLTRDPLSGTISLLPLE